MGIILGIIVLGFTVPVWWPTLLGRRISWPSFKPVLLLTVSSVIQEAFIILVVTGVLTLDYSFRFALLGLPMCTWSFVTARRTKRTNKDVPNGTVVCTVLGLLMWIFLVTLH